MSVKAPAPYEKQAIIQPPQIAYSQALSSFFVLGNTTYQVSTCPISALQQLVHLALSKPKQGKAISKQKRERLQELLTLLDTETDDLARWYVIEELLVLGVRISFISPVVSSSVIV